jgi:hypothetical protein
LQFVELGNIWNMYSVFCQWQSPCSIFQDPNESERYCEYEEEARYLEDEWLVILTMDVGRRS